VHNYYNLINLPLEIESDGLCAIAQRQVPSSHTARPPVTLARRDSS
jgi:hypothetical protein